jgi:CHRD domain
MTTRRTRLFAAAAALAATAAVTATATSSAVAGGDSSRRGSITLQERLSGFEETPLAISTAGNGRFFAQVDPRGETVTYRLSYAGLEGEITQAHIHFGAAAQSGGISAFLCTNLGNGPAGTQACPAAPATVTGTLRPADVIGPAAQGIAAGEFAELIEAIGSGTAYVNVHSTLYPPGEIRAQFPHQH